MKFIIVDDVTGKILTSGTMQQYAFDDFDKLGQTIRENVWGAISGSQRWDAINGVPVDMDALVDTILFSAFVIAPDELLTISQIPVGTTVHSYGKRGLRQIDTVNDGVYEYDTDAIGEHLFAFKHPHYKDWLDVEVTCRD